jgi:hypothetical protein
MWNVDIITHVHVSVVPILLYSPMSLAQSPQRQEQVNVILS